MSSAIRTPLGHRVVHVSQEAQIQMVRELSTSALWPRIANRITWSGKRSIANEAGQPFVHLRHWKHCDALNGPAASALSRKLKSGLKLGCCIILDNLRFEIGEGRKMSLPHSFDPAQGKKRNEHVSKEW